MTLGLPAHLAARTISNSFLRAVNAIGMTCIVAALATAVVFQADRPAAILWPAIIAVLPMGILLWLHGRSRSLYYAVAYLTIGSACTYWYIATFLSQATPIVSSDAFSIALPKIALVMVGGVGSGLRPRLIWAAIGYVCAEIASAAALLQTGRPLAFDETTFLVFAMTALILILSFASRRFTRRSQPLLHRAVRDEEIATMRYRIEVKAAALMHDTVLSHLAAIAGSQADALSPQLESQIARDLEVLIGEEWLSEESGESESKARQDWRQSGLYAAIQEARDLGLEVESTGDLTAVSRLDRESSVALGLAVKQCLVNVIRHSGTMRAEVVAYGAEAEVSIMVIDAGRGFDVVGTGSDRLGLRHSVRRRMEAVGGTVQVWSTPGRGTSIMIRVPAAAAVHDADEMDAP